MIKYLLPLIGIIAIGCEDDIIEPTPDNFTLEVDGRLDTTDEGYYKLELSNVSGQTQTIHRITGTLLNHGMEPFPAEKVSWESSHEWYLTDTAGFIVRRVVNAFGQWAVLDTFYITGFGGTPIPTINPSSYSGTGGEINTVIAPINDMKGDTMTVRCTFRDLEDVIYIILE